MIIITGGIGSGKSIVCRTLEIMGFPVYDCDKRAKELMNSDPLLREQLIEAFGTETYLPNGLLNKPHLASKIFNNPEQLALMNSLVHPAVARDVENMQSSLSGSRTHFFVETAIYYESGFNRLVHADQVWCVAAPLELRITRAQVRDHSDREQILSRINSQISQEKKIELSDAVIWNDNTHSVIEQINLLLQSSGNENL